jgi:sucrose-6-phosphate hydrolase SacC (GH32 family)
LVADFEGPDFGAWTTTGDAFGSGPAHGPLPGQAPVGGYRGNGFASSFHGNDKGQGTLTSPEFAISKPFMNFLVGGGEEVGQTCVNILVNGQVVRSATGRQDEFLTMTTFDLHEYVGKRARIQIVDSASGGWGHINADHFVLSDKGATLPFVQNPEPLNDYSEALRPQFHFTARQGWLNDPNGLVAYNGEYHLFFQHNPKGREWGNMTWGHAVSTNLVRWTQLDNALLPDKMGTMFSGSAVVDRNNTGGFQTGSEPALVAFYTAAGGTSDESKGLPFTQCLAYSNDKGRTWTKYSGNPVIGNVGEGDRDPKVFWHGPSKHWVMPLYVGEKNPAKLGNDGKPTVRNVCHFYISPDLKHWTLASKFAEELYECPGLVELPVNGKAGDTRWVLWGASGEYWIGKFDGSTFTAETGKIRGDYGANFYAPQAYDDLPDKRVILIGWMNGGKYKGMPFNQQMGFPTELTLQKTPEGIRLIKWPVAEISQLFTGAVHVDLPRPFTEGNYKIPSGDADLLDVEWEFVPGTATSVGLDLRGNKFVWDAKAGTLTAFGRSMPLPRSSKDQGRVSAYTKPWGPDFIPWEDGVRVRVLLDRTSAEVFGNGGLSMASYCFQPGPEASSSSTVTAVGGDLVKARLTVRPLKSAWKKPPERLYPE